jgi:hypothetical protein
MEMRRIRLLAALVCVSSVIGGLATAGPAGAAVAPSNDTIAGATVVPALPFSDTVDTTAATTDADDAQLGASDGPDCAFGSAPNSVWYKFTAGTEGKLALEASGYVVGLVIATGSPGALTTSSCGLFSAQTPTVPGTTYYVLAFDVFGEGGGTLDINFLVPPPPPTLTVTAIGGTVNRAGAATINFAYTCTNASTIDAFVQVTQAVGRFSISGFDFLFSDATCDGTQHIWSTTIFPQNGKFSGGRAELFSSIEVCGSFECTSAPELTQSIQLRRNGK